MSKAVKAVSKPFKKIKVPKIKIGDPTKLITKPVEGFQNSIGSVAKNAVGNVGEIMKQPGAGALLGMAATASGVPGAGLMAGALTDAFGSNTMAPSGAPVIQERIIASGDSGGGKDNTLMIVGAGIAGLVLVVVLFLVMRKGKR